MAYIFDTSKGETPEIVAQRRKMADALAARIFGRTPQNVGEGLSALGQAWIAGTMRDEADAAQKAGQAAGNAAFSNLFGGAPQAAAPVGPVSQSSPSEPQIVDPNQVNSIDAMADLRPATQNLLPRAQSAIAGIESGGRYGELGPVTKTGDRAYGKYQVMGANIPRWTKEVLGREMTPQEFVASPDAQDAVFNGKFGGYMQKYGPEGAAKAWFAGEGGMNNPAAKDQLGTTVAGYGQRFSHSMGGDEAAIPPAARPTQAQPVVPPSSGPDLNTLIQASTNPWLSESQRAVVNTMLQQKLKEQDPLHQLQLKKAQADLDYGKNPESVREYEYAKAQGFAGSFQDWIATKRAGAGEYGLQGIPVVGPDGEPALAQLGKSGTAALSKFPEGYKVSKKPIEIDGGTETILLDPITRQRIGSIPKDLSGKKSAEAFGKGQGEARLTLPQAKTAVDSAFRAIDALRGHPGIDIGTGLSSVLDPRSWIPGQPGYDFSALNEQAQGKAFMAAREALKGAGQVTDFEGQKGEQAIANLKTAQSKEQYLRALDELERMLKASYSDLQKKAGVTPNATGAQAPGGNTTSGGVKWSVE